MDTLGRQISYFDTYEAREAAFNRFVAHLIPSKTAGPGRFWQEFRRIADLGLNRPPEAGMVYITANPRDGLVYGSPYQVLVAARMVAGIPVPGDPGAIGDLATEYGLRNQLDQPIRTLSGGETVKLALARAKAGVTGSRTLVVASPFCWLSHWNAGLLDKTIAAFRERHLPVHLLALSGEDDTSVIHLPLGGVLPAKGPRFELAFEGAEIELGMALDTLHRPPDVAAIADAELRLRSPCLVTGDNGQGKTLVAKALSGAVKVRGRAAVRGGSARLLFQNVITQTLLRSPQTLRQTARDGCGRGIFDAVLTALIDTFEIYGGDLGRITAAAQDSLLVAKFYMVAARLCSRPALLILDEPDWGLARREAAALVLAVVTVAHAHGVALMLVSHKPWWGQLAASRLGVEKNREVHENQENHENHRNHMRRTATRGVDQPRFRILLHPQGAALGPEKRGA
jgi:ABC-type branched-subunit amino acid transport system ATPase component